MMWKLLALTCIFPLGGWSQLRVHSNTSVSIESGTNLRIFSDGDTVYIDSNAVLVNDGILDLDTSAALFEAEIPVTGTGFERREQNSLVTAVNIGGLGLEISPLSAVNNVVTRRYHTSLLIGAGQSIARYYDVQSSGSLLNYGVKYYYTDSELGINDESKLVLASSYDGGTTWELNTGVADIANNTFDYAGVSGDGVHTLLDSTHVVSVAEQTVDDISVFPNPVASGSSFLIRYPQKGIYAMQITDISGKVLLETTISTGLTQMTADMERGIYLIQLFDGKRMLIKRLVIR